MSLPTQADLLGFEWGFAGDPFVVAAAKSTLDPGTPEWNFGGVPLLFNLSSGDPAADRAVTALNAMVLAGNPSTADALVTVIRSMIVRSSSAPDADRSITKVSAQALMGNPSTADAIVTVLRKMVLRTQDDPSADRRVSRLAMNVLRSVRRGDVARPGVQGRVIFNDTTVTPGEGEYAAAGYWAVGAKEHGWTGQPYLPHDFNDGGSYLYSPLSPTLGPKTIGLPVGYGNGGDVKGIVRKWHAGLSGLFYTFALYTYPYNNPISISGETDDDADVDGEGPGGNGFYPVGLSTNFVMLRSWGAASNYATESLTVTADYDIKASYVRYATDPSPDAQQWALKSVAVIQNLAVTYADKFVNGDGPPYTFRQMTGPTLLEPGQTLGYDHDVETQAPALTLQHGLGRGAYRIAQNSYRDWEKVTGGLPPLRLPLQGANDPLDEMYGVTYGSESALWNALLGNADLSPMNLDWPARAEHTFYKQLGDSRWYPVIPHRWGPLDGASDPNGFISANYRTNDDGLYVTGAGEVRYSRYKTIPLVQRLGFDATVDVSGAELSPFLFERALRLYVPTSYSSTANRGTTSVISWNADDVDPTVYNSALYPPCFFLEKLDSPSTHFNDPPGTPGVDDF